MGYKEFEIKVPANVPDNKLEQFIVKQTHIRNFNFRIIKKSLDARNKRKITWSYRIGITSHEIKGGTSPVLPSLNIEHKHYQQSVLIVGSGPAGIFSALVLALSGMKVTLIEQGNNVVERRKAINRFETSGVFNNMNNYSFGEGGAGTFSDGKLTSRTKSISLERNFIFTQFIQAGAPDEILYMTHPHIGSDNLFNITQNLRKSFEESGGQLVFNTKLTDLLIKNNKVITAITSRGDLEADFFILAPGHSSYETYKMLIRRGVPFQTKNFAIGMRAEHNQETINRAQWGVKHIPGIKAAEYRLTSTIDHKPFYSFCMCPGGKVVPATAYEHTNIVNGMSLYSRDSLWANAAIVAGIHPDELTNRTVSPVEALELLESLEHKFYSFSKGYNAPAIRINDFIYNKTSQQLPESSYPFKLISADLNELLPESIISVLRKGLFDFNNKLKGYETGTLIGLESKTSSPVQAIRNKLTLTSGFNNLYIAGEGSGWAGGIISSAADGIRAAMKIIEIAK